MGKAKAELAVSGIAGPGLVSRAEELLAGVPGVDYAHVNLGAGKATVNYDDSITDVASLISALKAGGYGVEQQ